MIAKIDPGQLDGELARLADLSLDQLKARWLELKGVPLPKFLRRGLMTLAVSHALRVAALGGLDAATQKRLDILVAQIVPTGQRPPPKRNRIKSGTRLVREWQGRVHEVSVVPGGFLWNGERHASLSAIARQITGTRWNGWVFFGLKRPLPKAGAEPPTQEAPRSETMPRPRSETTRKDKAASQARLTSTRPSANAETKVHG